jgi:hypothetical protein
MAAAAVFLSGTTVGPANLPPIPPPPGVALPLVSGALLVAATTGPDPKQIEPTMTAFAAQGMEIVKRLGGWDTALQLAYDTHHRLKQEYDRATAPPPSR